MNGLDCLKEEMIKRGCTKTQTESKLVPIVLEILAQGNGIYFKLDKAERDLESIHSTIRILREKIEEEQKRLDELKRKRIKEEEWFEKQSSEEWRDAPEYIQNFHKALENCETQAGRDALKRAQLFINSVNIDTKYDNTAFIVGLASLLSNVKIEPLEELKKINKKIQGKIPSYFENFNKAIIWRNNNLL